MYGYVYKVTLPNGYTYIGSHASGAFDESYWGSSENPKYWQALFKAGKENVKREVLSWHETKEEMLMEEYRQIQLHPNGYNTAHLRKNKEEKRKAMIEDRRALLLTKLAESKARLADKICKIENEIQRITSLPDEEILTVNMKTGYYNMGKESWNVGKTKENDERIKKIAEKQKETIPWNKGKKLDDFFDEEKRAEIRHKISTNNKHRNRKAA